MGMFMSLPISEAALHTAYVRQVRMGPMDTRRSGRKCNDLYSHHMYVDSPAPLSLELHLSYVLSHAFSLASFRTLNPAANTWASMVRSTADCLQCGQEQDGS